MRSSMSRKCQSEERDGVAGDPIAFPHLHGGVVHLLVVGSRTARWCRLAHADILSAHFVVFFSFFFHVRDEKFCSFQQVAALI